MLRRALARLLLRLIGPELRETIGRESVRAVADAERRGGILFAHRGSKPTHILEFDAPARLRPLEGR